MASGRDRLSKLDIIAHINNGLWFDGTDVVRANRDRTVLTHRFDWSDCTDNHVLLIVQRAAELRARRLHKKHGKPVEIRNKDGSPIVTIYSH